MVSTHSLHLDPRVAYEQTNPISDCSFLFRPYCAQILLCKGSRHDRLLHRLGLPLSLLLGKLELVLLSCKQFNFGFS